MGERDKTVKRREVLLEDDLFLFNGDAAFPSGD